jgi:uncharacterized protein YjaG (DUF416 family)
MAMTMLRYDEKELIGCLQPLPNRLRVAFAAACAERQILNYLGFCNTTGRGDPSILVNALRCVWNDMEKTSVPTGGLQGCLDACMALLPEEDQGILDEHGYADDAVMAVAVAIRALLTSDVQEAVAAANTAYSALDERVAEILEIRSIGKSEEAQILAHPLVQAELERQRADLLLLQEIAKNPASEQEGIAELRRRAQADARVFFNPAPK